MVSLFPLNPVTRDPADFRPTRQVNAVAEATRNPGVGLQPWWELMGRTGRTGPPPPGSWWLS